MAPRDFLIRQRWIIERGQRLVVDGSPFRCN